jgi:predicted Zn-dependent protease
VKRWYLKLNGIMVVTGISTVLHVITISLKTCLRIIPGWVLLLFASLATADDIALPNMGDPSGAVISPEQERQLGETMMRQARQSLDFVTDPEVNEYINSLGYRLASYSNDPDQSFTFFVISDPMINAFAAPGGFIAVNSGLIMATESESELASVIAHEIAHITQKHMARTYAAYSKLQLPVLAAVIAGILIGSQNPDAGAAAVAAAQAGGTQSLINFTRSNEQEADRMGIQALARAGYDSRAMAGFFQRLQQSSRVYGNRSPEFLSTHPVTTNRIAEAQERAAQHHNTFQEDSLEYLLTRYKLRVLESHDKAALVKELQQQYDKGQYHQRSAHLYGMALAQLEAGNPGQARQLIEQLMQQDRERIAFLIVDARALAESGSYIQAKQTLRQALDLYPHNHALTMHYAHIMMAHNEAEQAYQLLDSHSRRFPNDPATYHALATAAGDSGHKAAAHVALAEYYYLNGQLSGAIQQLNLARDFVGNNYYLSERIEARLQQFEQEQADSRPLQ